MVNTTQTKKSYFRVVLGPNVAKTTQQQPTHMGKTTVLISPLKQREIHSTKLEEEIRLSVWIGERTHRTTNPVRKMHTHDPELENED